MVIPYYHDLLDVLEKYIKDCSDLIVKEAIKKARTKLNKYYSDANSLVYIIRTSIHYIYIYFLLKIYYFYLLILYYIFSFRSKT